MRMKDEKRSETDSPDAARTSQASAAMKGEGVESTDAIAQHSSARDASPIKREARAGALDRNDVTYVARRDVRREAVDVVNSPTSMR